MEVITIGNKTFEALSCERMRHLTRGFYLAMEIPAESIGMDELYALLNGNKETIIVRESDGTENEYNGFNAVGDFSCSKGIIHVSQFCESELQAQLSLAQSKIKAQDAKIAERDAKIAEQDETINALLGMEG